MAVTNGGEMDAPKIHELKREQGIAGQYAIRALVEYPGEPVSLMRFYGNVAGGPVVAESTWGQVFVTDPGRFGEFGEAWVRRFFGAQL